MLRIHTDNTVIQCARKVEPGAKETRKETKQIAFLPKEKEVDDEVDASAARCSPRRPKRWRCARRSQRLADRVWPYTQRAARRANLDCMTLDEIATGRKPMRYQALAVLVRALAGENEDLIHYVQSDD
jgi:hypothetical protein